MSNFHNHTETLFVAGANPGKDIKTYAVTPLNEECGLIEWVDNLRTLRDIIVKLLRERGISPNVSSWKVGTTQTVTDEKLVRRNQATSQRDLCRQVTFQSSFVYDQDSGQVRFSSPHQSQFKNI